MNQDLSGPAAVPQPWGFVSTIVWGAVGIGAWFGAQFVVIFAFIAWRETMAPGSVNAAALANDGLLIGAVVILAGPAWVGVSVLAARWRGWQPAEYLALRLPRRGEIVFGVACLAAVLVATDLLNLSLGRDVVPRFMVEAYQSARASHALVVFFIAVVIVGPVAEEIAFRGFLFRGLSASWLGVGGTVVATSAAWAAMHVQYDLIIVGQIFCIGLLLGWLRWASSSTLLTIMLHVLANLTACIQAVIKVEWMS